MVEAEIGPRIAMIVNVTCGQPVQAGKQPSVQGHGEG